MANLQAKVLLVIENPAALVALGRALARVRADAESRPWDPEVREAREDLELAARHLVARPPRR